MWMRYRAHALALGVAHATLITSSAHGQVQAASPNGRTVVTVEIREGGLFYSVQRDNRAILLPSRLGFEFQGAPPLRDGLRITGSASNSVDETWTQPWGEVARVRDSHNERRVSISEVAPGGRQFVVVCRIFNDGVGFRYEF